MDELLKKMNYKGGTILVADAPKEFASVLEGWKSEAGVREIKAGKPSAEGGASDEVIADGVITDGVITDGAAVPFLLVFAASEAEVKARIPPLAPHVGPGTVFWVAFPKKTSPRYSSDINRDILWKLMEPLGFRPNRNVAIDDDWSALRFAPL